MNTFKIKALEDQGLLIKEYLKVYDTIENQDDKLVKSNQFIDAAYDGLVSKPGKFVKARIDASNVIIKTTLEAIRKVQEMQNNVKDF